MNPNNVKYDNEPGQNAFTYVSDQFGPFATWNISATASEALYIPDGLLMNETSKISVSNTRTPVALLTTSLPSQRFWPTGSSRATGSCRQNVCMSLNWVVLRRN